MTAVRARFEAWVELSGGADAVADALGITRPMVCHLQSGARTPGLGLAVRIERKTLSWSEGPIRPSEWLEGRHV